MKWVSFAALALLTLAVGSANAQAPAATDPAPRSRLSPGDVTPTPEMWFYEQYRRDYDDPKLAVRRAAEIKARQRRNRLAAQKWFGYSNSRPQCNVDPFNGDWSFGWTGNNSYYPMRWSGVGRPWVVVQAN